MIRHCSRSLRSLPKSARPTRLNSSRIRTLGTTPDCLAKGSVPLTRDRYPGLKRGSFNQLTKDDVMAFTEILDEHRVLTKDIEGYNVDWLRTVRGEGSVVLKPKSTDEVSQILQHCSRRELAVCPQGGNTGLVGGSVPVFDEVILSMGLMNNIENLDVNSCVVTVQAGVILEHLDQFLAEKQLMVPLDLGAKGSCHIGGNVSTNAGGLRLLRYGNLHGSVLGLEVVLADGKVLNCMSEMKKDNTGYDLKHLFIGSEGTLGIVTKVALQCPPRPQAINVALLGLPTFENVLRTFKEARSQLGEILSSCEFIDAEAMTCVTQNLDLVCPIGDYPFYMLIETSGSRSDHDEEKLTEFLSDLLSNTTISDGTIASSETQIQQIWPLRERIAEALLHDGYCYKYDISLPLDHFYESVTVMRERLGDSAIRCVGYGHVGDGNMHLNITSKDYDQAVMDRIEPFLYEWTSKWNGSISAEHGLGFKKRNCIHFSKSESAVETMKAVKHLFDPKGILNPYKVLPDKQGH